MKKILVLAGPSAVGKTTVMKKILEKHPEFEFICSATTREKRQDAHESEYIYLSIEEFKKQVSDGKMLEYTEFGGNFYGTPASEIERIFSDGKIPLLILDINGVKSLKSRPRDFITYSVYILADIYVLDARLYERAVAEGLTEKAVAVFKKRKAVNRRDIESLSEISSLFDAKVINLDISDTADNIIRLFKSE